MGDRRRRRDLVYLQSARGCRFKDACYDCVAVAAVALDDDGEYRLDVWHQITCPTAAGIVPWRVSTVND